MHIALIISSSRPIDAERTLQLVRYMKRSGVQITVLIPYSSRDHFSKSHIAQLISQGCDVLQCPVRFGYRRWLKGILVSLHSKHPMKAVFALQPDHTKILRTIILFTKRNSVPFIFCIAGSVTVDPQTTWRAFNAQQEVNTYARSAQYIWTDSVEVFALLQSQQCAPNRMVYITLYAVDIRKIALAPAPPVAWDISVVTPLRGAHNLQRLLPIVDSIPNCRMLVIGDGPDKEHLMSHIKQHNLDGRIQFTGWFPQPNEVISSIKSTRIFVCISSHLQSQYMLMQAMACQVPVIAQPSQLTSGLIEHEVNGIITTGNMQDLKEKILWCLEHQERRTYLAEKATADIAECAPDIIQKKWQHFFTAIKTNSEVVSSF